MTIERPADAGGTSGGTPATPDADLGAGPMTGDSSFALPDSFEDNLDEIEVQLPEAPLEPVPASGAVPPATPATPPPSGTPPAVPPTPAAAAATPPAGQTPPPATPAPAAPAAAATPAGEPARQYSPSELAQALGQNRDKMIDALAQQRFQLSPAEIQALEVDAVGILPKLMARVYFDASVNALQQLANMVPRMVEHVTATRITENEAEGEFYKAWPNIDKGNAQHMRTVGQLAQMFRQMNPNASQQEAIEYVGQAASAYLKLQPPAAARPGNQTPPPRRGPPPFTPANGGRAQPPAAGTLPAAAADPFAGMAMNFDE